MLILEHIVTVKNGLKYNKHVSWSINGAKNLWHKILLRCYLAAHLKNIIYRLISGNNGLSIYIFLDYEFIHIYWNCCFCYWNGTPLKSFSNNQQKWNNDQTSYIILFLVYYSEKVEYSLERLWNSIFIVPYIQSSVEIMTKFESFGNSFRFLTFKQEFNIFLFKLELN